MKDFPTSVLALTLMLLAFAPVAAKDVYVPEHYTKHGVHVRPHMRTAPDRSRSNNWSTKGNTNPYTGKNGAKSPLPNY